ncbi:ATP-binding protein [Aquimarina addita]|uniref:histidine kinase n=1 Tax=Aquimarina addita TaxID=870485 RepID=A0ABP6UWF8_9FLAO
MESPSALYPKKVDLTNCDKEPIHIVGKIQNHGYLIACNPNTLKISYFSQNCLDLFDVSSDELAENHIHTLFSESLIDQIKNNCNEHKIVPIPITLKEEDFILIAHSVDTQAIIIELEKADEPLDPIIYQQQLSLAINSLSAIKNEFDMCKEVAQLIKSFFDYDRVMIYQFDSHWNGKVVAEEKEAHLESWLGLQYPATDIPQQARKLFLKQGVRIVADVSSDTIPITNSASHKAPLDLSNSELRAVSPIHIEYLTNMGVGATLTAAIIYQNELWGLIACHHYSPKFLNYHRRLSVKLITQMFSSQLGLLTMNIALEKTNQSNKIRLKLIEQMSKGWDIESILSVESYSMLDITEAEGAALFMNGAIKTIGNTPEEEEITKLISWIQTQHNSDVLYTSHLGSIYADAHKITETASGILTLFISNSKNDMLIWFKPEVIQTVDWGGNPNEKSVDSNQILSPRKSFAKWTEEQSGHSLPWSDMEIASTKALKDHITNIIVEKYDEINFLNKKLVAANEELESFSYSVSHDLRSPLRGIDGFAQIIKEDYFDSLDEYGQQAINTIISSINKMNTLIDDILAFAGLGKTLLKRDKINMQELISDVLGFLQVDRLYANTYINVHQLPPAYGDRGMIFQLLINLIGNALKYSSKEEKPNIEIGYENEYYYIKDNGIGFDISHVTKIFGVFNRLVNDEYQGSGIGLAISKRVVEKHGGDIKVRSTPQKGSVFSFNLNKNDQLS